MTDTWRKLVPVPRGPYRVVSIHDGAGKQVVRYVHDLILEAFVGPKPQGMESCHDPDHTPTNNRLDNLRYGTRMENRADMVRHGTVARGSRQWKSRLNEQDIPEIRKLLAEGHKQKDVGILFGVGRQAISDIARGKNWKDIT